MRGIVAQPRCGAVGRFAASGYLISLLAGNAGDVLVVHGRVRYGGATVHDHIHSLSAAYGADMFGQGKGEADMQYALFAGDNGEVRVGRKALFRPYVQLRIARGALPAALFVAAGEKAYSARGDIPLVKKLPHGVQAQQQRTFVVQDPSAVYHARVLFTQRRVRPPLAQGDGVQMSQNGKRFPFAYVCGDVIAVLVVHGKAHGAREEGEFFQHLAQVAQPQVPLLCVKT